MESVIQAEGLVKKFKETTALAGVEFSARRGTVLGLLGPNGSGKTTSVRVLTTLLRPDGGRARILGHDVVRDAPDVRRRIGLTGQYAAVDDALSGVDNLVLVARLLDLPRRVARARAAELLEQFGLTDAADRKAKTYSGGMKRRLDLAASFIMRPQVLFLDEPTTGQDPRNRNEVWDVVRSLVAGGTTVLLTTHYLDEADQLADQICVIDRGRVIADGTPDALKSRIGGSRIDVVVHRTQELPTAAEVLERVCGADAEIQPDHRRASAPAADRVAVLGEVLRALEAAGVEAEDTAVRKPTLDEVFLTLTGEKPEVEQVAA
jgi:daunorubicin resistance ABC transporter ATP-binding subunit